MTIFVVVYPEDTTDDTESPTTTSATTECVSCGLPQARPFDTPDGAARLCPACAALHDIGCP